ncbi:transcriptional regulator, GntR family with LacI sensor [Candidatus Moduliflexus flocculans]|uniref:Transcriptional regulator, GntR family with LacI sensor n=1 Tax=Candidatus Moduliflexus flocculans TaxID=1499966 RepID=A0A081BRP5_9BACT|nr:transcriptional regulator, GntR family with LacI sensor [Candidatus Moduliflexus flocculans]
MEKGPKYERLKQMIRQNIQDGIWKPESKLPPENELCESFEVSKITVKKAKDELLTEGVLETIPGRKGVFIRKLQGISAGSLIGVVIDDVNVVPFTGIFKGIEDKLWENKLHSILGNVYFDPEKAESYLQSLLQNNIAGVITVPMICEGYQENNRRVLNLLKEKNIPSVLVDRYLPNFDIPSVVSNNRQASKEMAERLFARGHRRILAVSGLPCSSMDERVQGYIDAFEEAGIERDPNLLIRSNEKLFTLSSAHQNNELARIKSLIQKAGDFTACYFMNAPLQTTVRVIFPNGRDGHQQVEFAAYDEITEPLRSLTNRALIVVQPGYKVGWEAAKLLIQEIREPHQGIVQMTIKSEIIEKVLD